MTDKNSETKKPSRQEASSTKDGASSQVTRSGRWERLQFWIYFTITTGVLVFLLWPGSNGSAGATQTAAPTESPVQLTSSGNIQIAPGSSLQSKLKVSEVKTERLAAPVLTVTGTIVAAVKPIKNGGSDWQFASPELLTTYTDWKKAGADIAFAKSQLDSIGQLSRTKVEAQDAVVKRLEKLVAAGTETERALAEAKTELLQAEIEGRKDRHEADAALRLAQRTEAALSRQLQQEGIDPALLLGGTSKTDIVVADVPETMLSRVTVGQSCEARFLGIEDKVFSGAVRSISPVLSEERRTLRVLFTLKDPDDVLRPGMFADIGLGTDAREALLAPIDGVVHVGRSDFMLVRTKNGELRIAKVEVGELHEQAVEILSGLEAKEQVVGEGAILLKPLIVEAKQKQVAKEMGEK